MTNSENERTEYRYKGSRLIEARKIGAGDPTWRLFYLPKAGALFGTRFTDPTGVEVRYRYDAQRRLYEEERVATGELTQLAVFVRDQRQAEATAERLAGLLPEASTLAWDKARQSLFTCNRT